MRTTNLLLATLKESPAEAEVISHQLMLRAGLIRKLTSGLYIWLPLGLRVLRKVENIVREEMNNIAAQELLMPVVQPAELWHESERWQKYGPELLRIKDRHKREFCLGPTHEEVITDLVRNNIQSYKQLPATFYQIQTKFRDEIRPRFGVMRSREFIMKDAYSFHISEESLDLSYQQMYQAYSNIFSRLGLTFRAVQADTGSIGGNASHEFHVLADSGEDDIAFSDQSDYAANIELAQAVAVVDESTNDIEPETEKSIVSTPDQHSIAEVSEFLKLTTQQCIKTLVVKASEKCEADVVALALRGDHELNELKAEKLSLVASPLTMATDEEIMQAIACNKGSIGPIELSIPLIVDHSAALCKNFACGANVDGQHYINANWSSDLDNMQIEDIRNIQNGDPSPDGKGFVEIKKGIEVGHIFQLGKTYSEKLKASVLNEQGKNEIMSMGCYGIGITRVVAAAIEQHHDKNGIIWPLAMAPFKIVIIPMNMHKSERVKTFAEDIYQQLSVAGIEVLFDDRKERAGIMFADMELIGIPYRLIIGDRGLDENKLELKSRYNSDVINIAADNVMATLLPFLKN